MQTSWDIKTAPEIWDCPLWIWDGWGVCSTMESGPKTPKKLDVSDEKMKVKPFYYLIVKKGRETAQDHDHRQPGHGRHC